MGADRPNARCSCGHPLDLALHATCDVCGGALLCLDCARTHLCSAACAARGCIAGLCVKVVRDGAVAQSFGVEVG